MIEQYVTQCPADFERRAQRPQVIATVEHLATASKEPVRELADPCTDALHAARNRAVATRFDQQMQVVALDRIVHHTETVPHAGLSQGGPEPSHEPRLPQRGYAASQPDRHMHRHAGDDRLARSVHDAWPNAARPTRTVARPTTTRVVASRIERELFDRCSPVCHGSKNRAMVQTRLPGNIPVLSARSRTPPSPIAPQRTCSAKPFDLGHVRSARRRCSNSSPSPNLQHDLPLSNRPRSAESHAPDPRVLSETRPTTRRERFRRQSPVAQIAARSTATSVHIADALDKMNALITRKQAAPFLHQTHPHAHSISHARFLTPSSSSTQSRALSPGPID